MRFLVQELSALSRSEKMFYTTPQGSGRLLSYTFWWLAVAGYYAFALLAKLLLDNDMGRYICTDWI